MKIQKTLALDCIQISIDSFNTDSDDKDMLMKIKEGIEELTCLEGTDLLDGKSILDVVIQLESLDKKHLNGIYLKLTKLLSIMERSSDSINTKLQDISDVLNTTPV